MERIVSTTLITLSAIGINIIVGLLIRRIKYNKKRKDI